MAIVQEAPRPSPAHRLRATLSCREGGGVSTLTVTNMRLLVECVGWMDVWMDGGRQVKGRRRAGGGEACRAAVAVRVVGWQAMTRVRQAVRQKQRRPASTGRPQSLGRVHGWVDPRSY